MKEKKHLEQRIDQLKREIENLMNTKGSNVSDFVSVDFVEQKGVKATSTRFDWSKSHKFSTYL